MSLSSSLRCLMALASALACSGNAAQATSSYLNKQLHLDAFGTAGVSWTGLEAPSYKTNLFNVTGIDSGPSFKNDARVGLQLGWVPSERFEFNIQGLLKNDANDETRLKVSWAYLLGRLSPQWSFKLGRMRTLAYLYADTLDVGYVYPWARPPSEMYTSIGGFDSIDGMKLSYQIPLAGGVLRIEPDAGATQGRVNEGLPSASRLKARSISTAVSFSRDALETLVSFSRVDLSIIGPRYQGLIAICGPALSPACNDHRLDDFHISRLAMGLHYDDERWMLTSELAHTRPDTLAARNGGTAGYVSVGRHFGNWLPYVTYARMHASGPRDETRLSPAMNDIFTRQLRNKPQQHTWTLGARWDALPNVAVKLQADHVHPDRGSPGLFSGPLPPGRTSARIYSLALDWTL